MASPWSISEIDLATNFEGSFSGLGDDLSDSMFDMKNTLSALPDTDDHDIDYFDNKINDKPMMHGLNRGFSCFLKAPTSPSSKLDEETLTYLNQGQLYELLLKYEGSDAFFVRSSIRVTFHERQMESMEAKLLESWHFARPGDRFLDIEIPHSYGFRDTQLEAINTIGVVWNVTSVCGLYIRLNCISTEFTQRKHGGEKGVPFRIQVDTCRADSSERHLISVACQVKVFKPKGADRKYKTDQDKLDKKFDTEKLNYKPSCTMTELQPVSYPATFPSTPSSSKTSYTHQSPSSVQSFSSNFSNEDKSSTNPSAEMKHSAGRMHISTSHGNLSSAETAVSLENHQSSPSDQKMYYCGSGAYSDSKTSVQSISPVPSSISPSESQGSLSGASNLSVSSSAQDVSDWLQCRRFSNYVNVFHNFAGLDMLRLTRKDIVELCGPADGIRLMNCLNRRPPRPQCTIYIKKNNDNVFHAVFLYHLTLEELVIQITALFNARVDQISGMYIFGPGEIPIILTSEVISNFEDKQQFTLQVAGIRDGKAEIFLKTSTS